MRNMKRILVIAGVLLSLTACKFGEENQSVKIDTPKEIKQKEKTTADVADQDFKDGMTGKVFHNYLEIKMALGNEDPGQVSDVAKSMAASFETERPELKQLATELSEASEIQEQRRIFAEFTSKAGDMFEEALSGGTIYRKFCPMAFNNEGAYWYADVEKDTNPYFGSKMPECGAVEKTITKK